MDSEIKILLVDDSSTHRSLIQVYLTHRRFSFLQAENGEKALEVLDREPVDLAIVDINMPGMNGIELIRKIRRLPDKTVRRLPVIVLSGIEEKNDDAMMAGANACLQKPVHEAKVAVMVDELLGLA